ncbi:uncharacterized protein LOC135831733 [Planococcus citri]|uniref:uncharacterized protein LOC135831733 n=1 Tax=Planococcus citri TaxID=170843 RepID=UPI0031F95F01
MNVFFPSTEEMSLSSDNETTDSDDDTLVATEDRKMWKLITSSSLDDSTNDASIACYETERNLDRGVYKDVSVQVESYIYNLDQVTLALKSDYFEKLFTSDFVKMKNGVVEIQTIDSDTFSTIIDIMYDDNLEAYLNVENFAALLIAMDYLQMQIDLKVFRDFLTKNLQSTSLLSCGVCKLLGSIADNSNFEYLLPTIYQYLSIHLINILRFDDFLLLPIEALVKIITRNRFPRYAAEKQRIPLICTKWICNDIGNRLIHMTDLVNAAKYRYGFHFKLDGRSMDAQFLIDIDNLRQQKKEMERYFNNLLNQNGQIDPAERELKENNPNAQVYSIINKINEKAKWSSFLENKYFCDITVKVGKETYHLHRWKLDSSTNYFYKGDDDEKSPKTSDTDVDFELDDIDELTFDAIIEYIYFDRLDFESNVEICDLLRSSELLRIYELTYLCINRISVHLNTNNPRIWADFIKILNFIVCKDNYNDLCVLFREHIVSTWPKICTLPDFCTISCIILESILKLENLEINHPDEILDSCSKWIAHDAQNRYQFLPRIANSISRNHHINPCSPVENPADWKVCSVEFVKNKLWEMLRSVSSVISNNSSQNEPGLAQQPAFIAPLKIVNDGLFDILDLNFNIIKSVHLLSSGYYCEKPSAALINNNLFILFKIQKKFSFQVYNLASKKFFSLALFNRLIKMDDQQLTLLNCNDELYCCCENGAILKYSALLNRWRFIVKNVDGRDRMLYTSNGNTLYRFSRQTQMRTISFIAEAYDFEENMWISLPELPSRINRHYFSRISPTSLTAVDNDLAVSFASDIVFFNHEQLSWYDIEIGIPGCPSRDFGAFILTQRQGKVVCMRDKKLWYVSTDNGKSTSNQKILPDKYSTGIVAVQYVS